MFRLFSLTTIILLAALTPVRAGRYPATGTQSFPQADFTTDLADTSVMASSGNAADGHPFACVQANALRLAVNGSGNSLASFKLPQLDIGKQIQSFDATFTLRMTATSTPADGWSLNVGPIPAGNGSGEGGFVMANGLTITFDTYTNGGSNPIAIYVYANGIEVGRYPITFTYDTTFRNVAIHWDSNGLDLTYTVSGTPVAIFNNLPTPGYVPSAGHTFAFSARTGGATQDTRIDDLLVSTVPEQPVETGGPVISEFVADNGKSYDDENGDASDWIEIYNGQNASAPLSGWRLTNDAGNLALWTFPAITLTPYEHRVIFASGKNRVATTFPLHTNFTLQKEGGYVALVRPTGTVASSYTYGAQFKDISYGLLGNGAAITYGFIAPPTPGTRNIGTIAANGPAEDVQFLKVAAPTNLPVEGGLFAAPFQFTFQAPVAPGAVIRYTTNNTIPTAASSQWTPGQNFTISATSTYRAGVFLANALPGAVSSRTWLLLDSTLTNYNGSTSVFSSHLPVLVLDSYGFSVDSYTDPGQARPYRLSYAVLLDRDATLPSPNTNRTLLTGKADFQGRCGTHVRGESSSGFDQKTYAWELWDNDNNDKDSSLLGMPAESDWILYGPYTDKTFFRNYLAYSTMRETNGSGTAMRARFIEVFFNQDGGSVGYSDYRGVYLLVEKIKQGQDRVDIAKLPELATDPAVITGGYVFKHDKAGIGNSNFNTNSGVNFQGSDPETWNAAQQTYLQGYLNQLETALNGANFADPAAGYAAYLDRDSFIDNQWWVEICKQIDGYRISTYFSKDRGGKVRALPLWDYNLALGNADYNDGYNTANWYYTLLGGTDYFWYPRLHQDPNYNLRQWDRYWDLRRRIWGTPGVPGGTSNVLTRIDSYVAEVTNGDTTLVTNSMAARPPLQENAAMRHYRRYPILGAYVWPNAPGYASRTYFSSNGNATTGEVDWMKNWLQGRLAWIDDQNYVGTVIYRPPVFSSYGGSVAVNTSLTITRYTGTTPGGYSYATGGTLYYTTNGSDPRSSTGAIVGTAYSTPLNLASSQTVNARLYNAGTWSPLTTASFVVNAVPASAANLALSEICYHPPAPAPGSAEYTAGYTSSNDFEYIELLNVSGGNVDLTGVQVAGGITFNFASAPPSLLTLAPGARILVVGNQAAFLFRYGSGLAGKIAGEFVGHLSNSGDTLNVLAASTAVIASVTYGSVEPWPVSADTLGYSLVLNNPAPNPAYGSTAWRSSAEIGGTPGAAAGPAFAGNPNGDTDGDGYSDYLEWALGSAYNNYSSLHKPVVAVQNLIVGGTPGNYLTCAYRRNNAADGVKYFPETSTDLTNANGWTPMVYLSTTQNADGTSTITCRAAQPISAGQRQAARLRVTP